MTRKLWTEDSHHILETASGLPHYNRWIMSLYEDNLNGSILEVGSGLGGLSKLFSPDIDITLSDINQDYIEYLRLNFTKIVLPLNIEKNIPRELENKFDTIFSSNVFEHIKDDRRAFENCSKLLKGRGKLLLFVPASPQIYGQVDATMGHFRRYTRRELIGKVTDAGFKIEHCFYANLPGFFLWWLRGKLKGDRGDGLFSKIFDFVVVPLLYTEKIIHPPIGQSLVLIARK